MPDVRFMTLDPGHFHAALVQKEMYPGVAPRVDVYAPLGGDLLGHLARINGFNSRAGQPTAWRLEVHTGPDFLERMLAERPGNVVVLSGRNRGKIDRIERSVAAGLNVLADKPWILRSADLPALDRALADADARGVVAYDIMTERFEVTSEIQRALVNDAAISGGVPPGSADHPSVYMESIHHLMKVVAGAPNIRPTWFFDTTEQGEGLNDIGTHLTDLVQWTLFPEQSIDYKKDLEVLSAQRWPTPIAEPDFKRVTGSPGFPAELREKVVNGSLQYDCNTLVSYRVRGVHATLNVIWDWEAPAGAGDRHYAVYRGSKAAVEVRQTKADRYQAEVYVIPNPGAGSGGDWRRSRGPRGGAAGHVSRHHSRATRLGDPRRDSRSLPRRPRSALRAGHAQFPGVFERPFGVARMGAAEHGGEVFCDDDRDRVEPPDTGEGRTTARP